MSRAETLPAKWMPPSDSENSTPLPLLIRVPRLSPHPPHREQPVKAAAMSVGPRGRSRRRRRLRRKVKVAGYTVLAMVPLVMALWSWPAIRPVRASRAHVQSILDESAIGDGLPGDGRTRTWTSARTPCPIPPVSLSVEPSGTSGETDGETSVVFPGYLLPDDAREEARHE